MQIQEISYQNNGTRMVPHGTRMVPHGHIYGFS